MEIRPVTLREARRFIGEHHRHNLPPRGWRFGVALWDDAKMVGVGVASRPVARGLDDGTTIEIIRTCTDGTRNANSMIYGALCRAAKALGYTRAVTYTLAEESGASLKAAGFAVDAELEAREAWVYSGGVSREQTDIFGNDRRPAGAKIRWQKPLNDRRHTASVASPPSCSPTATGAIPSPARSADSTTITPRPPGTSPG